MLGELAAVIRKLVLRSTSVSIALLQQSCKVSFGACRKFSACMARDYLKSHYRQPYISLSAAPCLTANLYEV